MRKQSLFIALPFLCVLVTATVEADEGCLQCHGTPGLTMEREGEEVSLHVDGELFAHSVHGTLGCTGCHQGENFQTFPHESPIPTVDCGFCHSERQSEFESGIHGLAWKGGVGKAPSCIHCHGYHHIKRSGNEESRTFRSAIPALCGQCHRESKEKVLQHLPSPFKVYVDYSQSVHGKSLRDKGLLPVAICTDCHRSHGVYRHNDKRSPVHKSRIAATCGQCHRGIYRKYRKGVHHSRDEKRMAILPTCADCHSSHEISDVRENAFISEVVDQCGRCHGPLSRSYRETMHGKAYQLGFDKVARCSHCHDPHQTLMVTDPDSRVGSRHIVETCGRCHEGVNANFTGYLTHANHRDRENYPLLYATYVAMTTLLLAVFGFFGLHTLLWLPRSLQEAIYRRKTKQNDEGLAVPRFSREERVTHILVVVSFLLLALTGMMLKFSERGWAQTLAQLFGGVALAGTLHRLAAIVTFGYFFYHLYRLKQRKREAGQSWLSFLLSPHSLFPTLQDGIDFAATIKWFLGLGPKPSYGKWTYWEKFDYFAVFWGVPIIGLSGLVLWFPQLFTLFLPGWVINVALIVHSDEALLAVGFIFTIHFFNTHLRPDVFPMDTSIFTGHVSRREMKEVRGREYERMEEAGELDKKIFRPKLTIDQKRLIYLFGGLFLSIGILLVGLILYSLF